MTNENSIVSAFYEKEPPSLVNRVQEMTLLKNLADKATQGEGTTIFLYGEAGIGKTRLTKEIKPHANLRGMKVLYGRCPALFQITGVPPFAVWKEVIRDYLKSCTPEQLQRVVGSYPGEISKLIPETKNTLNILDSPSLSPDLERERLFEAIAQFLKNTSEIDPLIIIIDDLQWADNSSLQLLRYLLHGIYKENILFLGAYRDTEIDKKHPLFSYITELNRARLIQSTQLKRLSFTDTIQIIKQLVGQNTLTKEVYDKIFEKTNGNPFFIEEVITSLKEQGIIYLQENQLKVKDFSRIEFPRTVKDLLKERIDRLDEELQNMLLTASLIGNDFFFDTLYEAIGIEESKLSENMEILLKTGLLKFRTEHGENTYSFSDTLVRDVLCEEMSPFQRKRVHCQIAKALEKKEKSIDENLGQLAYHFSECGEKEKAFNYYVRAADKAAEIYANNEASGYYQSALTIAEKNNISPETITQILERLGDVQSLIGNYDECIATWNKTLDLLNSAQEKTEQARVHRKISQILWSKMGLTQKAEEHQNQALMLLSTEPKNKEIASLKADIARMYLRAGDLQKSTEISQETIEISTEIEYYEGISNSCITLGALFSLQGDRAKAETYLKQALDISINHSYFENAVYAYDNLAFNLTRTQEKKSQLEYLQKGFDLAKKIGVISAQSWLGNNLSDMLVGMGNINDAFEIKQECVAKDRRTGNLVNLSLSLASLGHLYQIIGNFAECEKSLTEARTVSLQTTDLPAIGFTVFALIQYYIEKEQYEKTVTMFRDSYEFIEKNNAKLLEVVVNDLNAQILIKSGKFIEAEKRINRQYSLVQELNDKEYIGFTHALTAVLLCKQGKWQESIEHFQKATQTLDDIDEKNWNIYEYAKRVLNEHSQVYLARKQQGDKEKAVDLLNQALKLFKKINAKNDVEKTEIAIATIENNQKTELQIIPNWRTPTGYLKLDNLLQGGIPSLYSVALISPACDSKDSLVRSFLEKGLEDNEITFYITTETELSAKLAQKNKSNLWVFLCNPEAKVTSQTLPKRFLFNGVGNLTEIGIALIQAIQSIKTIPNTKRRICINVTSDILLQHHAVTTRRWLTEILTLLKSNKFTTLSVIDPLMHPSEELYAILGVFDGEINLRQTETDNGLMTFLRVKRMRDQEYIKTEVTT